MKVSVIIPVYRTAQFVAAAVRSALQEPQVGEVLLIDDGSPDDSLAICQTLAAEDARIRVLWHDNHANRGISHTRNLGIVEAREALIAFLDSDDYYLPGRFTEAVRLLHDEQNDGVYEASQIVIGNDAAPALDDAGRPRLINVSRRVEPDDLFEHLIACPDDWAHMNSVTVRRRLFDRIGLFNTSLRVHEDTDMWLRMALAGRMLPGRLDQPVAVRRQNAQSITKSQPQLVAASRYAMTASLVAWSIRNRIAKPRRAMLYDRHLHNLLYEIKQRKGLLREKWCMGSRLASMAAQDPAVLSMPAWWRFIQNNSGLRRLVRGGSR